ncbi:MAG TPA: MmcQ/YjbR family DNA-binding protein [Devosia sp.]|nr:MmcQ/YjbR family DNA-binding protein [Devosia sp.]
MLSRAEYQRFAASLPGVSFVEQWGGLVAKVGGKVFAMWGEQDGVAGFIVFKVPETSFEILTALDGVGQAPYFAKLKWVVVAPGALPKSDVEHYVAGSHAIIAASLTKKLQRELGLLPPL